MAGLRKVLPSKIASLSAFTRLNREFLPPVDTVHATMCLEDGTTGLFGVTFASSQTKFDLELMGQEGFIVAQLGYGPESVVTLTKNGKEVERKTFKDANRAAIFNEFVAFGNAVLEGKKDLNGLPEEALEDLIIVESMIQSGEKAGQSIALKC